MKKKWNFHVSSFASPFYAFTLAEVLITLGVIGIVAAITIPVLMKNTQDQELKTAWKKEFSVMSQAMTQMAQDNGGNFAGVFTNSQKARNMFEKYLKFVKECDSGASFGNCWASSYKTLNNLTGTWGNDAGLILNDGASVMFAAFGGGTWLNCTTNVGNGLLACGYVPLDVNGPNKGPNILGRDIFDFWVLPDGRILPEGCVQDGRSTVNPCPTSDGANCSAAYLYQ